MHGDFVVWAWDGIEVELWRGPDAREALTALENARTRYAHHVMGPTISVGLVDDPERGDVELELQEALSDAPSMGLGVPLD